MLDEEEMDRKIEIALDRINAFQDPERFREYLAWKQRRLNAEKMSAIAQARPHGIPKALQQKVAKISRDRGYVCAQDAGDSISIE